jgi:hypothetical protein
VKKVLLILCVFVLLLSGCDLLPFGDSEAPVEEQTKETETLTAEPEPTEPWIYEQGRAWDEERVLLDVTPAIPGGMQYSSVDVLGDDLLLWCSDNHLEDAVTIQLCVVELDDGTVRAQRDICLPGYATVQILNDRIYLSNSETGEILALDENLSTAATWSTEPMAGDWYVGANGKLYIHDWAGQLWVRDLSTGTTEPWLSDGSSVIYVNRVDDLLLVEYSTYATGAFAYGAVDLNTGVISQLEEDRYYSTVAFENGNWLCGSYNDFMWYTFYPQDTQPMIVDTNGGILTFVDGPYLLYTSEIETDIALYDLEGNPISCCVLSETPYNYHINNCVWNEEFGGLFCIVGNYGDNHRILFWDTSMGTGGESLPMEPLPDDSETDALLKARAKELGEKYGVTILVSNDCDTEFTEFYASIESDYYTVNAALDTLDEALSVYPEGFIRQLRYGSVHGIQIHLITDLMADGSGRYGDGYSAFTQEMGSYYLMVMDIEDTRTETYYHEFSHIIDSYLEYDSWYREDALFSEERWNDLNPGWFTGYSYDYSLEHELIDWTSFVDGYSTISPTEDRARVMEYAMMDFGEYTFEDAPILLAKLAYYSRCIRDTFDTEGWPKELPWEQYLK